MLVHQRVNNKIRSAGLGRKLFILRWDMGFSIVMGDPQASLGWLIFHGKIPNKNGYNPLITKSIDWMGRN